MWSIRTVSWAICAGRPLPAVRRLQSLRLVEVSDEAQRVPHLVCRQLKQHVAAGRIMQLRVSLCFPVLRRR